MRVVISLCLLCFFTLVSAQDLVITPIAETLCRPGVTNKSPGKGISFTYGLNPNLRWSPSTNSNLSESVSGINRRIGIKLKAPILHKEKIKLLVGWNYYSESYDFDNTFDNSVINDINGQVLKSSRLSLYLIRPINHKYYFALKAVTSFNGDYDGLINFDQRYARYDLAMIFGIKKSEDKEWGIGLLARKNFNNGFPLIPFVLYNRTFNSRWGIESTLPISLMGRYNINEKSLFLFGPRFDGRTYSVDLQDDSAGQASNYNMRRSELQLMLRYQYNIKSWIWGEFATGYVHNFRTRFELNEDNATAPDINFLPNKGPVFNISIFLSPPKSMYK